jgi:hypothetical protein
MQNGDPLRRKPTCIMNKMFSLYENASCGHTSGWPMLVRNAIAAIVGSLLMTEEGTWENR